MFVWEIILDVMHILFLDDDSSPPRGQRMVLGGRYFMMCNVPKLICAN